MRLRTPAAGGSSSPSPTAGGFSSTSATRVRVSRDVGAVLDGADAPDATGIVRARRMVDGLAIDSRPGSTLVTLEKDLPRSVEWSSVVARLRPDLVRPPSPGQELDEQTLALTRALDELRRRQDDQDRLERELEETNRGVVALYAELDDRAERLRDADQAKSRFLSSVSHELRTPLNSMIALASLLLDRVDGPLTERQEKQVGFIQRSAQELLGLVDDLLDLAKIEAGHVEVTTAPFALDSLFGALRGALRPLLVRDEVALVFDDTDALPMLETDERKLAQIVRNFVSNALKFTERGEVRVSASLTHAGESVRICVADTGIGIAPEDQDRIFDEFTQVPGRLQAHAKGTGLGLALSRQLAGLLGGAVGVDSRAGQGSTFWVEIPVRHASVGRLDSPAPGLRVRSVLIVDDDPVSRYLVGQALEEDGVAIIESASGAAGLARARSERPDLVVLDLSLPDMDGSAVLERLHADAASATIPVVIYTSRRLDPAERTALERDAAAVVVKGTDARGELRDAVRVVLDRSKSRTGTEVTNA